MVLFWPCVKIHSQAYLSARLHLGNIEAQSRREPPLRTAAALIRREDDGLHENGAGRLFRSQDGGEKLVLNRAPHDWVLALEVRDRIALEEQEAAPGKFAYVFVIVVAAVVVACAQVIAAEVC